MENIWIRRNTFRTCVPCWSLFVIIVLTSFYGCNGQIMLRGQCPKVPSNKDFDIYRYLGQWYEYRRVYVGYQELGRCWSGLYKKSRDGGISVDIGTTLNKIPIPLTLTIDLRRRGYAPNKFSYTSRLLPIPVEPLGGQYEVLATDYENWTIEYDCRNKRHGRGRQVYAAILTRRRNPSPYDIAPAFEILWKYGIVPKHRLLVSNQNNCRRKRRKNNSYG